MWVADQKDTLKSLQDAGLSITKEDIEAAVGDVRDSTQVLIEDLGELDPPETDSGQKAKSEFDPRHHADAAGRHGPAGTGREHQLARLGVDRDDRVVNSNQRGQASTSSSSKTSTPAS